MSAAARRGPETRITVRVTPRAGRNEIAGVRDGTLMVRVAAPPVEGAANLAVGGLIAEALGIAPSRVRVVTGASGRRKVVALDDVDPATIAARWPELGV